MSGCQTTTHSKVLPAGKLYLESLDANDAPTGGEILFAEVDTFTTTVTTEVFEEYGGDGQLAELQIRIPTRVSRTGNVVGKSISGANLARFFIGTLGSETTTATPVADESIRNAEALVAGAWYQLGETPTRPAGIRKVTAVAIKSSGGTTTHVEDVDYTLDADLGRFQVIAGGGLDGTSGVTADYTPSATSWEHVETGSDLSEVKVALRWVADNLTGDNRDFYCSCTAMIANGDLNWKSPERNEVQQLAFDLTFQGPIYIDGRAA